MAQVLYRPDAIHARPTVQKISLADLLDALARGYDDFSAMPSHALFLCLIYPVVGLVLARLVLGYDILPLFFPLAAGFALLGPFAAVGLYELSRRREQGQDAFWTHAFDVFRSPALGGIVALGLLLVAIFLLWLAVAEEIYLSAFGFAPAASIPDFVDQVFRTESGWWLILTGNAIGFVFALVVLMISVVSFPMLLDRNVGPLEAVMTSLRCCAINPLPMAAWGLIVAALLAIGSVPFFFGLAVVLPVLGHATWHLYRKLVRP